MATTLANISIKDNSSWNTYLNLIYPVGSVYISYTSTSPATRFGGSWMAITGRFPYFNAGIGTGGKNTHTLTVDEMPSHNHDLHVTGSGTNMWVSGVLWNGSEMACDLNQHIQYRGGGAGHNNMPAYQTLYAWRRTA